MQTTQFITEGIAHITDPGGYDHMLFLLALAFNLAWSEWKKTLILITAFTVGHSITLGLSALGYIRFSSDWIERMIALSILLTAVAGLLNSYWKKDFGIAIPYVITTLFGLIHGAGFSSYFKMIAGESEFVWQLFQFNIGVEIGQIIILAGIMLLRFLSEYFKIGVVTHRLALAMAATLSLMMLAERI